MKTLIEKCVEYNKPIILIFVDYEKAFDSVDQQKLFAALAECRVDRYTGLLKCIYDHATASVSLHEDTNRFNIKRGMRQGDTISPKLFITLLEYMFKNLSWEEMGVNIEGKRLNNLRFADDLILITDKVDEAQKMLETLKEASDYV